MLKINLLPRQVRDRRLVPLYTVLATIILVVLGIALGSYVFALSLDVSKLKTEEAQKAAEAKTVQELGATVTTAQQQAFVAQARITFATGVQNTGPAWADYIQKLTAWVPANVYLDSWSINGSNLSWSGRLKVQDPSRGLTSGEYLFFYLHFQRCPMITNPIITVSTQLDMGYSYPPSGVSIAPTTASAPGASSIGLEFVPFTITGTLVNPPSFPIFAPAQQAAAAAALVPPPAAAIPPPTESHEVQPDEEAEAAPATSSKAAKGQD